MKTKLTRQFSVLIALLAFLALMAGNAFAACTTLHVTNTAGPFDCVKNERVVVSPYWQSDSGSYTFIAVSHTSLSGMASQIGVTVSAIPSNSSDLTIANRTEKFGNAVTFTVTSGTTKRVFIVRSAHPTINPSAITDAAFITGTSNFAHGSVRIDQVSTHPEIRTKVNVACSGEEAASLINRCSGNIIDVTTGTGYQNPGDGYTDATMMSYWGSVVVEKNTTGFAMEFIGDMNDSQGGWVYDGPIGTGGAGIITGIAAP
jgi:hypothetical protein